MTINSAELNEMQTFLSKLGAEVDKIAAKCIATPAGSFTDKDADEVIKSVREAKMHISAAATKLTSWQEGKEEDVESYKTKPIPAGGVQKNVGKRVVSSSL